MTFLLFLTFLCGVGNFAMHKAVAESGHPFIQDSKRYFGQHFGQNSSYAIEFMLLLSAMFLISPSSGWVTLLYGLYTALNALAAWIFLNGRI